MSRRPNCYEYLQCEETDCPMYGKPTTKCWEEATSGHNHPLIETFIERDAIPSIDEKCEFCMYRISVAGQMKTLTRFIRNGGNWKRG